MISILLYRGEIDDLTVCGDHIKPSPIYLIADLRAKSLAQSIVEVCLSNPCQPLHVFQQLA